MKSQHRHDLKTNELADWISHFPQWAKDNTKTIIYVAALIIIVAGLYIYKNYYTNVVKVNRQIQFTQKIGKLPALKAQSVQALQQGQDQATQMLTYADTELKDAETIANNNLSAALALIKQAEARRAELHYRPDAPTQEEIQKRMNRAKELYNQAIELADSDVSIKAVAKYGIGLCEEEMGNIDQAKDIYKTLSTDSQFAGTVAAAKAKDRLMMMDSYMQTVVFKRPQPMPAIPQQVPSVFENIELAPANEPNGQ